MEHPNPGGWPSFDRFADALDQAVRSGDAALAVAGSLGALWPASRLLACALPGEGGAAVLDGERRPRPDWLARLGDVLDRSRGEPLKPAEATAPAGLLADPSRLLRVRVPGPGAGPGAVLAVAVPADAARADAGPLLAAAGRQLELRLRLRALEASLAECEDEAPLRTVGEATDVISHEFNNVLNSILLQVSILKLRAPAELRADLDVIRQQGATAGALMRQLQQHRQQQRKATQPIDLNLVVREVAAEESGRPGRGPVRLALSDGLPPLPAVPAELKRLLRLLLAHAAVVGTPVTVATATADGQVSLRVEDGGTDIEAGRLADLFDPFVSPRTGPGVYGLELSACKAVVRRLRGTVTAEHTPAGGLAVTAQIPAAPVAPPA
jgi:signal transduction histidine kinase